MNIKPIVFIEEGSLDKNELVKLSKNSGITDADIITYKKGTAKPELVSVEYDGKKDIEEQKTRVKNYILNELSQFMCTNTTVLRNYSYVTMRDEFKTTYEGTLDDFIRNFEEQLNKGLESID